MAALIERISGMSRLSRRLLLPLAGAGVAIAIITGQSATASAAPDEPPKAVETVGFPTTLLVSATPANSVAADAEGVSLPPGDTIELRVGVGAAIGAVLGALAGLPFFIVGAIPGALIGGALGAGIGAMSWQIANQYAG
ncbi:hypothetical protein [Nocardia sp. NPDC050718]|uniref:hypothetical protein n=1 Tax=Nocardia sp. NPDC050718 TaxID=3155788 RepID=UPI00340CCEAB